MMENNVDPESWVAHDFILHPADVYALLYYRHALQKKTIEMSGTNRGGDGTRVRREHLSLVLPLRNVAQQSPNGVPAVQYAESDSSRPR